MKIIHLSFVVMLIVAIILALVIVTFPEVIPPEKQTSPHLKVNYLDEDYSSQIRPSEEDDDWNWHMFSSSKWDNKTYSEDMLGKIVGEKVYFLYPDGKKIEIEHELPSNWEELGKR